MSKLPGTEPRSSCCFPARGGIGCPGIVPQTATEQPVLPRPVRAFHSG